MPVKDGKTEDLIKETAKRIFFKEGKLHATTQDIADAAGVNRALLHYYFRSRDVLFDQVFDEAHRNMKERMSAIFKSDLSFREKMEQFVDNFIENAIENPYLESFMITEMIRNPAKEDCFMPDEEKKAQMFEFFVMIKAEMDAGTIPAMPPYQFLINVISLLAYPILAKPILQQLSPRGAQGWEKIMRERKSLILDLIFGLKER